MDTLCFQSESYQLKVQEEERWYKMMRKKYQMLLFNHGKWMRWLCCCSVAQLCPTLCNPMDCSKLGFPVLHYLPEFALARVHSVSDAIQLSHPLSSPSPPAFSLSQHQGLFKWVSSLHQVAKGLEVHLQHQSFHWIVRVDFPLVLIP